MQPKPVILIVIDDLGRGGAETLLVGLLPDLQKRFRIVLVTLKDIDDFDISSVVGLQKHTLAVEGSLGLVMAVFKLRKLIKRYQPALVHSHLLYSTIIGRFACQSNIPFVFSVHSELGKNAFQDSIILRLLEKITLRKNQTLVAVSDTVLRDYEKIMKFKGRKIVIENYIADTFYSIDQPNSFDYNSTLRIVAVGNIKKAKNYKYLVETFKFLKDLPVTIDIYGKKDAIIYRQLQTIIEKYELPVNFKGVAVDIPAQLKNYDLYVMSSEHEGFGMAAVEAMACGLPVMLSDLPVLREVSKGNAIFFDITDSYAMASEVKNIINRKYDLHQMSVNGILIARKFNKQQYLVKLEKLYSQLIPGSKCWHLH